ncbi:unnamed protein product [Acanthoscelides obtectus]|uniref:Uncharacterized protein n=1 Tax=Acanthoscelides obtectus TaxID=200917 RepID=A0A9P0KJ16_ACAOB|nr:unnamed protein product [Acanthoscelides obtectus]CAK1660500.1 hypothetical protein AOBTE_LOCUS22119 [Acanthoscelides obtectus]
MKPYTGDFPKETPQRIFNYRLSRGRRIVENAFGISKPAKAEWVIMTVILLHNYLRKHSPNIYTPFGTLDYEVNGNLTEGSWRNEGDMTSMVPIRNIPRRPTNYCTKVRDEIANYFINNGALEWQDQYA